MKNFTYKIIIVSLSILLTNCSSSFFTLNPDEESSLELGRKVIEKETAEAYSSIVFEEQTKGKYTFQLFVYNKDEEKIIVDPKNIYFKIYDKNRNPIREKKYYAYDPEEKIREINSDISYREDEHSVNSGLNLLFSLFDTAIDLSDDEDNNLGEVLENVAIYSSNQINENISYDEDMDYLESQKYFWKNKVLRITELDKDEEIDGMFFTPILTEAKYIKLFIPLGKTIHTYKFKQTLE